MPADKDCDVCGKAGHIIRGTAPVCMACREWADQLRGVSTANLERSLWLNLDEHPAVVLAR